MSEVDRKLRVYVAGSSAETERAVRCMNWLRDHGIVVTSSWPEVIATVGIANPRNAPRDDRATWTQTDLAEVQTADVLWLLAPNTPTRGAWIEYGFALAVGRMVVASGDTKQTIFTAIGDEYGTDAEALEALLVVRDQVESRSKLGEFDSSDCLTPVETPQGKAG